MFIARVQEEDFDVSSETKALQKNIPNIGAIVTFTGVVRPKADNQSLKAMTLEHYPGMADMQLNALIDQAKNRFDLDGALVVHRYGRLYPRDNIVLVVTASKHRKDAFDAAAFLMDWLKTKAPFWKKEELADNQARWVDCRETDLDATDRWS
ncbi:MAG: molybdenum cofactor biosynthesis protein MoaE [Pseudomonadota bacterium]